MQPTPPAIDPGSLPVISIVTPSYNQGPYIEDTIQSILSQDYPRLQYFVIDGGSKDNTVEVIKKYADRIDYWVSEKDRGQSHAINKGIARSTGQIFNWINSDDQLAPGALWAVARAWMETPGNIVAGRMEHFGPQGTFNVTQAHDQTLKNFVRFWEAEDTFVWNQQATFLPLADLQAIGGVREHLHFCMDYDMMVRLMMRNLKVTYVEHLLSRFRYHELSKTTGSRKDFRLELIGALRAIPGQPIAVEPWEWDAQQARRMVDVAKQAWRLRDYGHSVQLFCRALRTSPGGAVGEIRRRFQGKLHRNGKSKAPAPAA